MESRNHSSPQRSVQGTGGQKGTVPRDPFTFLRVRSKPGAAHRHVGRVNPHGSPVRGHDSYISSKIVEEESSSPFGSLRLSVTGGIDY
jgi:hypothetical protein